MLSRVKRFLSEPSRFQKEVDPVERFARSGWSKAATPDQLIAAHLAQLFATEHEKWQLVGSVPILVGRQRELLQIGNQDRWVNEKATLNRFKKPYVWQAVQIFTLTHSDREIRITYEISKAAFDCDNASPWIFYGDRLMVQGVAIDNQTAMDLMGVWRTVAKRVADAKAVAARALIEMEANEKKWNLAEQLLGMKRDETGALVPAVEPTHVIVINGRGTFETVPEAPKRRTRTKKKSDNRFDSAVG